MREPVEIVNPVSFKLPYREFRCTEKKSSYQLDIRVAIKTNKHSDKRRVMLSAVSISQ